MSVSHRRDLLLVGAVTLGLTLLGGVQANAADAPEVVPLPALRSTTTTSSTTTTAPSTTTTTAPPPPPSTTTTTAPPPPPPESSVDAAIRHWFGDVEAKARDVAWCESRMDPRAVSSGGGNHGLFQINDVHADQFAAVTGASWADGRYDAFHNAHYARWLYDQQGWEPWACA